MKAIGKTTKLIVFLMATALMASCGGGGGGGASKLPPNGAVSMGAVEGYVYVPVWTEARGAYAPVGYKAVSGATISVLCGSESRNTSTNNDGYYGIGSLPTGDCLLTVSKAGFTDFQTTVTVSTNQTTTVGGTSGVQIGPSNSGSIQVIVNVSGGSVLIDGKQTNITIPVSKTYTFAGIKPGNHIVALSQTGLEGGASQTVSISEGTTTQVSFTMNPPGNHAPTANAGLNATCLFGNAYEFKLQDEFHHNFTRKRIPCQLDGSGSSDPDNNTLTYRWEQISGPPASTTDATASRPTFIPMVSGEYSYGLSVSDGFLRSATVTVAISTLTLTGKLVFSIQYYEQYEILSADLGKTSGDGIVHLYRSYYGGGIPRWSPDGNKITFADSTGVFTMNANGSEVQHIKQDATTPDYSPDGTKIAYTCASWRQICIMNADGSNNTQLTNIKNGGLISGLDWNPDGTQLAFVYITSDQYGKWMSILYKIKPDGTNATQLTNSYQFNYDPRWTPDGKIIYDHKSSESDTNLGLFMMNADGLNVVQLGKTQEPYNYEYPVMSTDGTFIFYLDGNIHVMTVDGKVDVDLGLSGDDFDYSPHE